jgi:hypothetical protein
VKEVVVTTGPEHGHVDEQLLAEARRPLEDVQPIDIVEVDELGEDPPEDWYQRVEEQTRGGARGDHRD